MASPTTNKGFTYPAHGGSVNAWDSPLNTNFDQLDALLGNTYNIVVNSSIAGVNFNSTHVTVGTTVTNVTMNTSNSQALYFPVTGNSTGTKNLIFPAVGAMYVVNNLSTASFTLNAKTAAGGSTTITLTGISLIVTDATSPYNVQPSATFASGTALLFPQASAPSGWTQDTSINDRVLRMTSGSGAATGGTWTISGLTVGNTTLTLSQIPSHDHTYEKSQDGNATRAGGGGTCNDGLTSDDTGNSGGGGSHTHSISASGAWRPSYYDVIRATKT